jgi:SLT domain-containing protein
METSVGTEGMLQLLVTSNQASTLFVVEEKDRTVGTKTSIIPEEETTTVQEDTETTKDLEDNQNVIRRIVEGEELTQRKIGKIIRDLEREETRKKTKRM